jgi:hypothetical protein
MRRTLTALLVVGLVSVLSRDAAAQTVDKDQIAAAAILGTPAGALSPVMVAPGAATGFHAIAGRYSMVSPKVGDADNVLGATGYMNAGKNAAISGTLGYYLVNCPGGGCDNGIMAGVDVNSSMWKSAGNTGTSMNVNLQGSLGYGKAGDVSALSAVVGVPLSMSMEQASKSKVSFFVTPGFGFGRLSMDVSGTSTSESGTRPLIGAGAAWTAAAGWGIHAGFQKIIVEDGPNTFGAGFSWNLK